MRILATTSVPNLPHPVVPPQKVRPGAALLEGFILVASSEMGCIRNYTTGCTGLVFPRFKNTDWFPGTRVMIPGTITGPSPWWLQLPPRIEAGKWAVFGAPSFPVKYLNKYIEGVLAELFVLGSDGTQTKQDSPLLFITKEMRNLGVRITGPSLRTLAKFDLPNETYPDDNVRTRTEPPCAE